MPLLGIDLNFDDLIETIEQMVSDYAAQNSFGRGEMNQAYWRWVGNISAVAGLIAVIFGVAYYAFKLDSRLETLENQMKIFISSPTISGSEKGTAAPVPEKAVPNPVVSTCTDLLKRAAAAKEKGEIYSGVAIENLLKDFGCAEVIKSSR